MLSNGFVSLVFSSCVSTISSTPSRVSAKSLATAELQSAGSGLTEQNEEPKNHSLFERVKRSLHGEREETGSHTEVVYKDNQKGVILFEELIKLRVNQIVE